MKLATYWYLYKIIYIIYHLIKQQTTKKMENTSKILRNFNFYNFYVTQKNVIFFYYFYHKNGS